MYAILSDIHYIYIANDIKIQAMNILDFAINFDEESVGKNSKNKETKWGINLSALPL